MNALFDANLSPRLARVATDMFPGSVHVFDVGLGPSDGEIWEFAKSQKMMIFSKDSDFYHRSVASGPPPKVVWLRVGNASTPEIEAFIRRSIDAIADFATDPEAAFLVLGLG